MCVCALVSSYLVPTCPSLNVTPVYKTDRCAFSGFSDFRHTLFVCVIDIFLNDGKGLCKTDVMSTDD